MTYSTILDRGLNPTNNLTDITGIDTYVVSTGDSIIYSTDSAPHVLQFPLAAQAGVGKIIILSPTFGWTYEIHFQGSDSTNGLPSTNPVFTNNSSASFTSNGVNLWLLNSGVLTD